MTNDELNRYILHYLTKDKTNSAIMLTGDWGIGKSFYIQNSLKPFLENEENGKHQCVIVSLYGLKDTAEISKSIYLGTRLKFLDNKSEKATTAKFAGKTIVKGVAGFFGVDLSKDEEELQRLYESVDLSGKLIILEDLERSGINIIEVLGYVNNLVEQDGVKVLLVANESELLIVKPSEPEENDDKNSSKTVYSEMTEQYLKIKEKTVSDTILFGDWSTFDSAIETILCSFKCTYIDRMLENKNKYGEIETVATIHKIMQDLSIYNLRSFLFGCQKTVDLFAYVDDSFDLGFLSSVLYSNIAFALKIKANGEMHWNNSDKNSSSEMGTYQFPLLKVSYDYIMFHYCDQKALIYANQLFIEQNTFQQSQNVITGKLSIIYSFYTYFEQEVIDALSYITDSLEKTNDIPCNQFGKLANYLVCIKSVICQEDKIKRCREAMINIISLSSETSLEDRLQFHDSIQLNSQEEKDEYNEWIQEMVNACKENYESSFVFNYCPENAEEFEKIVRKNHDEYLNHHCFAKLIDIEKLIAMLSESNPSQIYSIRSAFLSVYSFSNLYDFFKDDKTNLQLLSDKLRELLETTEATDKIVQMQLQLFLENLQTYIERL